MEQGFCLCVLGLFNDVSIQTNMLVIVFRSVFFYNPSSVTKL